MGVGGGGYLTPIMLLLVFKHMASTKYNGPPRISNDNVLSGRHKQTDMTVLAFDKHKENDIDSYLVIWWHHVSYTHDSYIQNQLDFKTNC